MPQNQGTRHRPLHAVSSVISHFLERPPESRGEAEPEDSLELKARGLVTKSPIHGGCTGDPTIRTPLAARGPSSARATFPPWEHTE